MAGNPSGVDKERYIHLTTAEEMPDALTRALAVASFALAKKKTWNGRPYAEHWLHVADVNNEELDLDSKIAGILHDVVEDSDVEASDLEVMGFNHHITQMVGNLTKRKGEKYFDAIVNRCSPEQLTRRIKKRDNEHNMDQTRSYTALTDKQAHIYPVSHLYLDSVDNGIIKPQTPIWKALEVLENEIPYLKAKNFLTRERVLVIVRETSDEMPAKMMQRFGIAPAELHAFITAPKGEKRAPTAP